MAKNFKYLDELIHGEVTEIVLDSDIILEGSEEFNYSNGINLDVDDLLIDGNGFSVDACGKARLFYCTGENITIKNLTLKNGFSKENGGAIHIDEGELTLIESKLCNNRSSEDGGAIFNEEGVLSI